MKIYKKLLSILMVTCVITLAAKTKKIFLDCFSEEDRNDAIFSDRPEENGWKMAHEAALKGGYEITTNRCTKNANSTYLVTHFDMPNNLNTYLQNFGPEKFAVILWEPPTVRPENFDKNLHKKLKRYLRGTTDLLTIKNILNLSISSRTFL